MNANRFAALLLAALLLLLPGCGSGTAGTTADGAEKKTPASSLTSSQAEKAAKIAAIPCSDKIKNAKFSENLIQVDSAVFDLGAGTTLGNVVSAIKSRPDELKLESAYNGEAKGTSFNVTLKAMSLGGEVIFNGTLNFHSKSLNADHVRTVPVMSVETKNAPDVWFPGGIRADGCGTDGKPLKFQDKKSDFEAAGKLSEKKGGTSKGREYKAAYFLVSGKVAGDNSSFSYEIKYYADTGEIFSYVTAR